MLKKFDLSQQKIVQFKFILQTNFGEILSAEYEVVVVTGDKLQHIFLLDTNFYFQKFRISDQKFGKIRSSHQEEENFMSILVKEDQIGKNSDGKFEHIIDQLPLKHTEISLTKIIYHLVILHYPQIHLVKNP